MKRCLTNGFKQICASLTNAILQQTTELIPATSLKQNGGIIAFPFFPCGKSDVTRCQRCMLHLGRLLTSSIYVGLLTKAKQCRAQRPDLCGS